jgi:hypothetical protein
MEPVKEFEILVRKRIPFISHFLYVVVIFLLTFLFLLYLVMLPAIYSNSSQEMATAYYIMVVPDVLKTLSSYSFLGLVIIVPLYYRARLHKSAILLFGNNNLVITGQKINISIPRSRIRKVYCNDLKNVFGEPKRKLQVIVQQGAYTKTVFRLKNYEEGGDLIDSFGTLDGVVLTGYDTEMVSDHQDDE